MPAGDQSGGGNLPSDIPIDTLRKDALGVPQIVFFVVAAAAPLTAVVGVTPASFSLGNGPGVPLTFLLVGVLFYPIAFTIAGVVHIWLLVRAVVGLIVIARGQPYPRPDAWLI